MEFEKIKEGENYLVYGLEFECTRKLTQVINGIKEHSVEFENDLVRNIVFGDGFKQIEPLKPKLPETGLVVSLNGSIVMRTGEETGYGFKNDERFIKNVLWSFDINPKYWLSATKEDEKRWKELLIKEAKRRGFVEGAKTENGVCGDIFFMNHPGRLSVALQGRKAIGFNIFSNGKWAEIIEKPSQTQQFTERICDAFKNRKQPKTVEDAEIEFAINKITELAKSKNIEINITINNK